MKLRRKTLILIVLVVMIFTSSCGSVPKEVVKVNNKEMTSVTYNGVEYIEREYDSVDNFRPFLCYYSLVEFEYNFFNKDIYSVDESFVADKRDENVNFIYIPTLLWETTIYQKKDFEVPEIEDVYDKIDSILIVYPDTNNDDLSEKQVIEDPVQISSVLEFFGNLDSAEVVENKGLPADNKKIDICAVSGYCGGEFDVSDGIVYYSDNELTVFLNGKHHKAPEEINEIFRNTKRTDYEWGVQILV